MHGTPVTVRFLARSVTAPPVDDVMERSAGEVAGGIRVEHARQLLGTRRDDPGSKPSMPMLTQSDVVPLTACGAFRGPGHGPRPDRTARPAAWLPSPLVTSGTAIQVMRREKVGRGERI